MSETIIAICDDEVGVCNATKKQILAVLYNLYGDGDELFDIKIYNCASALLKEVENIDMVFLDIEMPAIDGIEAGKAIKDRNPDCCIIMATSNDKRYGEAFRIDAHRYLNKPLQDDELEEAIVSAMKKASNSLMEVYQKRIKYIIPQSEIQYIKAYNGYIELHVRENVFTKNISLDKVQEELEDNLFYRIHRQYIAGLKHIECVIKNEIHMKNGEKLPISRRCISGFEKAFVEYDLNFGGRV